ncbi:MAG TPA: PKD domain-containing protein [Candidatus Krumholzibacteriaceae bacterium]|nr:PKD domain-containing protein [Candidatus Krumholzibacteriaceae bacterium]
MCHAQTASATISGIVKDSNGNPVAGATVNLYGVKASGTTSASGTFSLRATFTTSSYYVIASKTGYVNGRADFKASVKYVFLYGNQATLTPNYLNIVINHYPTANVNGPYSAEATDSISFNSSGSTDPDGFIVQNFWDFGDGTNSTDADPSHAYAEPGTYTVSLKVTDDSGDSHTATTSATISPKPPIADANGPYIGGATDAIEFSSEGSHDPDGNITQYEWDFGDESEHSFEADPSHVYTLRGNYTVALTVTDDDNVTDTDTTWCDIAPRPPVPNANGPYAGITGDSIPFSSAGSYDIDGDIVEYRWNLGDGSGVFMEESPSHVFTEVGNFTITLTVEDNEGLTGTATTYCIIELPPNVPPEADISAPTEGTAESPMTFSSSGSVDTDGEVVGYTWDFGDGSLVSNDANPAHTYAEEGTYTVTLTVTDDREGTDTATFTVTVEPKPFPIILLVGALVVVGGAAAGYYFLVMKKKPVVKATALRVTVDPSDVPGDGRSTAQVKVEVLDDAGAPIAVDKHTVVSLSTTLGTVKSPLTIVEGKSEGRATLTAGFELGAATVKAEAEGLRAGSGSFSVVEKKRYCMHCGAQMSTGENLCPKCGRMPPSGVDVKECRNCGDVIPVVANFCGECGAGQPDVAAEKLGEDV